MSGIARAITYSLAITIGSLYGSAGYAQRCNMNQRQVLISFSPQICLQADCAQTEKYLFLGSLISAYFKKGGSVESFRSIGPGDAMAGDAEVGFEYTMNVTSDVLADEKQSEGVRHAMAQLSPGSKYLNYTIRASQDGDIYKLEDRAEMLLPYNIGRIVTEVTTNINILDCNSCQASIVVTQVTANKARSTFELPVSACEVRAGFPQ